MSLGKPSEPDRAGLPNSTTFMQGFNRDLRSTDRLWSGWQRPSLHPSSWPVWFWNHFPGNSQLLVAFPIGSYPMIPSVGLEKLARFGKMAGKSAAATPNQFAMVAAYWSSEVVGTHRPSPVASSGPFTASVGNVP